MPSSPIARNTYSWMAPEVPPRRTLIVYSIKYWWANTWSGMTATLLPRGRTVHSAFCLPVPINETRRTSLMSIQSKQAKDLLFSDCIICDEAPVAPKFALKAVDQLLRDIAQSVQPFDGETMILGGEFRQIPPVVAQASRMEVVNITIKNCSLWPHFRQFSPTENMRT
ncbi:hypothetical protein Aduo_001122 [Ancylostoma duodenale]